MDMTEGERLMKKRIDKDIEVALQSNVQGSFSLVAFRDIMIELDNHGDEDFLTFGELKKLASSKYKSVLQKLNLIITDVESDEFTVEDVIDQLKLTKYYEPALQLVPGGEKLNAGTFSEYVLNCSTKDLEEKLKIENISAMLIEAAVSLYREKELVSYDKLQTIANALGVADYHNYFSDVVVI